MKPALEGGASRTAMLAVLVAALAVTAYLSALGGEFLYDDLPYITDNPLVNPALQDSLPLTSIFTRTLPPSQPDLGLFRPLTVLSWALQARIGGLDAFGFH